MRQDFRLDQWIVQPTLGLILSEADAVEHGPSESTRLGHKVMAVLECLAERPGEVVTKEELFERVWDGAFTTDEALATVVYELRKALGDDARRPRYVETIRKGGYRLIAPVSPVVDQPAKNDEAPAQPRHSPRPWARRAALPAAAVLATAVLAVTVALATSWLGSADLGLDRATAPAQPKKIHSVAIRPLSSFSNECRQDFFAGSLTEMLIADLAYLGPMDVIPIPEPTPGDPRQTSDLRADAVVEGSVLRSGDRLWISIQLVDSEGGQILWGGTYERELSESLDLQMELSREISDQIVSHVAP